VGGGDRLTQNLPARFVLQPLILPGGLLAFIGFHLIQAWGKQLCPMPPLIYHLQGLAVALGNWQQ